MNSVKLWRLGNGSVWYARVGEALHKGTREDCLAWLVERQQECLELSKQIASEIRINTWQEIPFAFAPGE